MLFVKIDKNWRKQLIDLESLRNCVSKDIEIISLREHSKASEKFVDVKFIFSNSGLWQGSIPYFYRRTGIFIETTTELCYYLKNIIKYFSQEEVKNFVDLEKNAGIRSFQTEKSQKVFLIFF